MTTLLPLGSTISDSKNMKFTLLSGPPVDKKCEHCGFPHLVSNSNLLILHFNNIRLIQFKLKINLI